MGGPIVLGVDFWQGLLTILEQFWAWVTDNANQGAQVVIGDVINMIRALPFIVRTDIGLVNTLSDLIGWNQVMPLADAVLQFGLLMGVVANAGHQAFGWRPIKDSLQRWFVTILLVRLSWQLMDWSLRAMNGMTEGIGASIPDFPAIHDVNPVLVVLLMLVWAVLLFQLVMACVERDAWLIILKPIAPLALLTWVLPQTSWVADKFIKTWTGWLVGEFFVVLAVAAMELLVNRGGLEGYFLSCGCMIVARKAITLLVPTGGEGFIGKVGPFKV